jgi:hypothetical protein
MMHSSVAYDGMQPVGTVHHGWLVLRGLNVIAEGLPANAEAWGWSGRHSDEGRKAFGKAFRIKEV